VDGEIVAKHSDALLGAMAKESDSVRRGCSGRDVGENFELDSSLEGHGELVGRESLMDASGVDRDWVGL